MVHFPLNVGVSAIVFFVELLYAYTESSVTGKMECAILCILKQYAI